MDEIKMLDEKLKIIVNKYEKELPVFNKYSEPINLVMRMEFADKNKDFINEINFIVEDFKKSTGNSLNKHDIDYLVKIHKTKYRYGFLMPSQSEKYEELFQSKY